LGSTIVGFAATTESFTNLMLLPRAWVTTPSWGSLFPSPVDQNWTPTFWNLSLITPDQAPGLIGTLALGFALGDPLQARTIDVDDFATVWPAVTLSNTPFNYSTLPDYFSFFPGYMAFSALGSPKHGDTNFLITANHTPIDGGLRMTGLPTQSVLWPKVGDDGTVVLTTSNALHVMSFGLTRDTTVPGLSSVG